jgi:hypothetical protein
MMNLFPTGLAKTIKALNIAVAREHTKTAVRDLAHKLTGDKPLRRDKLNAIIDELHRRCVYAPDPIHGEMIRAILPDEAASADLRKPMDADEACYFVMVLAASAGIECRFVLARYGRCSWTCFVAYENEEGLWQNVNPLRQKTDQVPNELVMGDDVT